MSCFKLHIDTQNDAFQPEPAQEIARLLREVADRIEREGVAWHYRNINDANGNPVGAFALKDHLGE